MATATTQPALTSADLNLIISALYAVTPTGGGSEQYHLAMRLVRETGIELNYSRIGDLQRRAYDEISDAIREGYIEE